MNTDEEKISDLYHQGNNESPSSLLDDAILSAAHDAVHKPFTDKNVKAKSPFSGSWPATVSIAAVLIITVILVPLIEQDTPLPTNTAPVEENLLSPREQEVQLEQNIELKREQDTVSRLPADAEKKQENLKAKKRSQMKSQEVRSDQSAPAMSSLVEPEDTNSAVAVQKAKPASISTGELQLMQDGLHERAEESTSEQTLATALAEPLTPAYTSTPKMWLAEIQRLIDQGEIKQARKEFEAFKKQYPDEKIEPSITEAIENYRKNIR